MTAAADPLLLSPGGPRVSVIVPNYNHAKYLRRRIDSVRSQTFQDFELILMDDASRDQSRSILETYATDPRVRLIFNQANSGSTFKQWNKGVAAATGQYIWLAESDDYADPRLLDRLVTLLDANPNVGVAYCQSNVIDADDRILRTTHRDFAGVGNAGHWDNDFIAEGRRECAQVLVQQNMIPNASAVVFRRSLFKEVGGADESMRLCGDWKLWASMLFRSDLAHVSDPLNYYRTHAQNVRSTTRSWVSIMENVQVRQMIVQAIPVDPALVERMREWIANIYVAAWLWGTLPERSLRQRVFRTMYEFDRHLRGRILKRVAARIAYHVGRSGKACHWTQHVLVRKPT